MEHGFERIFARFVELAQAADYESVSVQYPLREADVYWTRDGETRRMRIPVIDQLLNDDGDTLLKLFLAKVREAETPLPSPLEDVVHELRHKFLLAWRLGRAVESDPLLRARR
jgi:hypothetical protein